jgi:hypothetical protein
MNEDGDIIGFIPKYTVQAIPVIILLALSIALPTIYVILGLIKIPYKHN